MKNIMKIFLIYILIIDVLKQAELLKIPYSMIKKKNFESAAEKEIVKNQKIWTLSGEMLGQGFYFNNAYESEDMFLLLNKDQLNIKKYARIKDKAILASKFIKVNFDNNGNYQKAMKILNKYHSVREFYLNKKKNFIFINEKLIPLRKNKVERIFKDTEGATREYVNENEEVYENILLKEEKEKTDQREEEILEQEIKTLEKDDDDKKVKKTALDEENTDKKENRIRALKDKKKKSKGDKDGKKKKKKRRKKKKSKGDKDGKKKKKKRRKKKKKEKEPEKEDPKPETKQDPVKIVESNNPEDQIIEEYHPVETVFDKSLLDISLDKIFKDQKTKTHLSKNLNKNGIEQENYWKKMRSHIDKLILKGNAMIRKYIYYKNHDTENIINLSRTKKCSASQTFNLQRNRFRFDRKSEVEGDVVVFVDVFFDPKGVILAAAGVCDKNKKNQAEVGKLAINIAKLSPESEDYFIEYSQLMTIVHEMFHIFGFGESFKINFQKDIEEQFFYLNKLKSVKTPLIKWAHWDPTYIINDLMVPEERVDAVLSIFSLEYLDNISTDTMTNKKDLQDNFLMDEISDWEEFFNYKCGAKDEKSKYAMYCSKKEVQSKDQGCDQSYTYKTVCSSSAAKLKNDCYEKLIYSDDICINELHQSNKSHQIEHYGSNSRCFEAIIGKKGKKGFCLKFVINKDNINVHLNDDNIVVCDETNSGKEVSFKDIKVICPEYGKFVKNKMRTDCPDFCHGNGLCSNGKCTCFDGYNKDDNCESRTKTDPSETLFISSLK